MKANNSTVKEVPNAVTVGNMKKDDSQSDSSRTNKRGYPQTVASATALLEFNETKTWIKDIKSSYTDSRGEVVCNAYLIIQLLQKRPNAYPKKITNRAMLEEDYELLGYTVLQVNLKDGNIAYGTYYLEFFEGPIFIEELDPDKNLGTFVKITLSPPDFRLPDRHKYKTEKRPKYKLEKEDYDSYVVRHDTEEEEEQSIKTPETVATQHRINKAHKPKKLFNYAEFAQALGPEDKF